MEAESERKRGAARIQDKRTEKPLPTTMADEIEKAWKILEIISISMFTENPAARLASYTKYK